MSREKKIQIHLLVHSDETFFYKRRFLFRYWLLVVFLKQPSSSSHTRSFIVQKMYQFFVKSAKIQQKFRENIIFKKFTIFFSWNWLRKFGNLDWMKTKVAQSVRNWLYYVLCIAFDNKRIPHSDDPRFQPHHRRE